MMRSILLDVMAATYHLTYSGRLMVWLSLLRLSWHQHSSSIIWSPQDRSHNNDISPNQTGHLLVSLIYVSCQEPSCLSPKRHPKGPHSCSIWPKGRRKPTPWLWPIGKTQNIKSLQFQFSHHFCEMNGQNTGRTLITAVTHPHLGA
jgi:hypothetical protein